MTVQEAIAEAERRPGEPIPVGEDGHEIIAARDPRGLMCFFMSYPAVGTVPFGVYRAPTESYEAFWERA